MSRWYMRINLREGPQVPVQWDRRDERQTIHEGIAKLAHEEYARHHDQSFERLHERGGFGIGEILCLLADNIEYWKAKSGRQELPKTGDNA